MAYSTSQVSCCVPGCSHPGRQSEVSGPEFLCEAHFDRALAPRRQRFNTTAGRLRRIESAWLDHARLDAIIGSDRYLKLVSVTAAAREATEAAWARLKLDVMLSEGLRAESGSERHSRNISAA